MHRGEKSCQTLYADENVGMRAELEMVPLLANFRSFIAGHTSVAMTANQKELNNASAT